MSYPEMYIDVGFFLVSATHMEELYELERQANLAQANLDRDRFYRDARIFLGAQELATASVVMKHQPWEPLIHLSHWLTTRFAGGKRNRDVFSPEEFAAVRAYTEQHGFPEFARHSKAHEWTLDKVDPAELRAYYEAFERLVQAAPPEPHGLVVCYLDEEHREPPPPEDPLPDLPPMAPEDYAKFTDSFERLTRNPLRRQLPGWTNMQFEGRMLLGCLSPQDGERWLETFLALREDAFADDRRGWVAYYASMRHFSDTIEHALEDGVVETRAGLVYAIGEIETYMGWATIVDGYPLATPEQVRTGWPKFQEFEAEHGGADGLARWLLRKQRGWKLDTPRTAVARVREQLGRAVERGAWFVWLHDIYDWPGEHQVPEDFDWEGEGW